MEGYLPIPYPLWSCNHDSVPWVVMCAVIWSAIHDGIYGLKTSIPPPNACDPADIHCPLHITWSLHPSSVDALADVHGRSCNFPLIHPREVLLAWCWVIARPLSSHGIISLSLPLGVGLTGVGLVHLSHAWQTPTHKGMPVSDAMRRSQLQCRMCDCPCWFVTLYEGMSGHDLRHHLVRFVLPPIFNLPLSLKGISLH